MMHIEDIDLHARAQPSRAPASGVSRDRRSRYWVARSERRRENTERLRVFLAGAITIIAFEDDAATAAICAPRWKWRAPPIGPYDPLIAAQALRLKATLVTRQCRGVRTRARARLPELDRQA
jgi:predicted nucleic acid-binding protein